MGHIGFGLLFAVAAAIFAAASGAGVLITLAVYIGTGLSVLIASLIAAMMFDEGARALPEDPMLLPQK